LPGGFHGRILRVNLTAGELGEEHPPEITYRRYMGGSAMSLYFLLRDHVPGMDPLGPQNRLVFMSSVISGAPLVGLTRYTVAARSPLTGAFGEAEAGGYWGPELKRAGFDGIIIEGVSPKPVYLWIKDGRAEVRDAARLHGQDTGRVQTWIREELGDPRVRVAQCGPAGERLVRYACVLNELKHANGRTGMGAVMGSKNLRAVAVRGTQSLPMAEPERVRMLSRRLVERIGPSPLGESLKKYGTPMFVMALQKAGILPTRNFQAGRFEGAENISAQAVNETILESSKGCYACAVRCKRSVSAKGKYSVSPEYGGPEYETLAALGSACGVKDLEAVAYGNELCNRWGLDTISTGACIAFAMECVEKGVLSETETDGLDLAFGNAEAMVEMIRKIAFREGFGDVLAEGVRLAAETIGRGAERFALHVKGQELPMHDPRGKHGVALGYATSPTGADHIEAPHDTAFLTENLMLKSMNPAGVLEPVTAFGLTPQKVRHFVHTQQIWNFYNSLGVCNFAAVPYTAFTLGLLAEAVEAIIGWDTSVYELMELGERTITMGRMFNVREGFTTQYDDLPERLFEPLEPGTPSEMRLCRDEFHDALNLYYEAMGWDRDTGIPRKGRLAYLGLDWL